MQTNKVHSQAAMNRNGHTSTMPAASATMPSKRIVLFVTTTLNDSSNIDKSVLQTILALVLQTFGGYTLQPHLRGGWLNDDKECFQDDIMKVEIEIEATPHSLNNVWSVAEAIRRRLNQHAVFITIEDVYVSTVHEPKDINA